MSNLYIIATPIGNLDDLTLRAVSVLREVPVLIAEDTRVTRKVLDHIGASPKVVSFHRRSTKADLQRVIKHLENGDVALVSDAGTPGINDPGQPIVAAAIEKYHDVVPLPGPSSIMAALSVSGFYVDQFVSYGFLPAGGAKRRRVLREIAQGPRATIFFETPHRLRNALQDMVTAFNDRNIVVCREMTKVHEEVWRGTAREALDYFDTPRGEFVIVVAPLDRNEPGGSRDDDDAEQQILSVARELADQFEFRRDLVSAVADRTGLPKRQVYQILHRES